MDYFSTFSSFDTTPPSIMDFSFDKTSIAPVDFPELSAEETDLKISDIIPVGRELAELNNIDPCDVRFEFCRVASDDFDKVRIIYFVKHNEGPRPVRVHHVVVPSRIAMRAKIICGSFGEKIPESARTETKKTEFGNNAKQKDQ